MESSFGTILTLYVGQDGDTAKQTASRLSTESPITVETVLSISDALEFVQTEHVDCIVVEYGVGSNDGIECIERLRKQDVTLPLILCAEKSAAGVAREAVKADVDRYLPRDTTVQPDERLRAQIIEAVEEYTPPDELLDRMTDAFVSLDDRWRFTYLNEHGREIISEAIGEPRTGEELRGRSIWEVIPDAVETTFHEKCLEAMETQEPVSFENYYEPLSSWFDIRIFPSPTGISLYFYDITDQREYRSELERREHLLREIYGLIADKDRTFKQKVEALLTIARDELDVAYGTLSRIEGDQYTLDVVVGPDHELIDEGVTVDLGETYCERIVENKKRLVSADIAADHPDLTDRSVYDLGVESYLGTPVFVDDTIDGTICLYSLEPRTEPFSQWEVTLVDLIGSWISYERERTEKQAQLARERDRLDTVAGTLSHDLRNPLTTASLRLELVEKNCESEHIADVRGALERIEELIDDTLSMARLGTSAFDFESVVLDRLIQQAWKTSGSNAGSLQTVDIPYTIVGDESYLQQLFENLFSNAIDHASDGAGTVVVRVGQLADGEGLFVADNGPGIPPEKHGEVFERGHSGEQNGTGFGLAIVERIVEAHGGAITITESESGGARFEIRGIELRG